MSQWIRWARRGWLVIGLCVTAPGMAGAALDGSAPFICVVMGLTECDRWGACRQAGREHLKLHHFVRVNVAAKALEAMDGSGRKTAIHSVSAGEGEGAADPPGRRERAGLEPGDRPENGRDDGRGRRPRWRLPHRGRLHAAIAETMGVSSSAGVFYEQRTASQSVRQDQPLSLPRN